MIEHAYRQPVNVAGMDDSLLLRANELWDRFERERRDWNSAGSSVRLMLSIAAVCGLAFAACIRFRAPLVATIFFGWNLGWFSLATVNFWRIRAKFARDCWYTLGMQREASRAAIEAFALGVIETGSWVHHASDCDCPNCLGAKDIPDTAEIDRDER